MKLKKYISAALSAAIIASAAPSAVLAANDTASQTIEGVTYIYKVNNGKATIVSAENAAGDIDIPSILGDAAVTAIDSKAFFKNEALTRAVLPSTLESIGNSAFSGCLALSMIYIPNSVTTIGNEAFMSCTSLKTVSIGNSVTSIPTGCFYSCPSLIEANLPDGLAKIGTEAFFGCPSLKITIPDSVTEIGPYALGMQADARTGQIVKSQNFLMTGVRGSCAEEYASAYGVDFIDMGNYNLGDINGNGKVDASDASDVLAEYSRSSTGAELTFSPKQKIVGDMNGDSRIDSKDASEILSEYSRLATSGGSSSSQSAETA